MIINSKTSAIDQIFHEKNPLSASGFEPTTFRLESPCQGITFQSRIYDDDDSLGSTSALKGTLSTTTFLLSQLFSSTEWDQLFFISGSISFLMEQFVLLPLRVLCLKKHSSYVSATFWKNLGLLFEVFSYCEIFWMSRSCVSNCDGTIE